MQTIFTELDFFLRESTVGDTGKRHRRYQCDTSIGVMNCHGEMNKNFYGRPDFVMHSPKLFMLNLK